MKKPKPICPICQKADCVYRLRNRRLGVSPFLATIWFCYRCGKQFAEEKEESDGDSDVVSR